MGTLGFFYLTSGTGSTATWTGFLNFTLGIGLLLNFLNFGTSGLPPLSALAALFSIAFLALTLALGEIILEKLYTDLTSLFELLASSFRLVVPYGDFYLSLPIVVCNF